MQNHKIFEQFHDFCSIRPGEDKPWTVGTEHRQLQIYEPEFETAKAMKQMMVDHLKRRYFIIDANISVSIMLSDTEQISGSSSVRVGGSKFFMGGGYSKEQKADFQKIQKIY